MGCEVAHKFCNAYRCGKIASQIVGTMTRSRLDRDSFQNLLAGAFTVQHTLLDVQSPSIMHALQHLIVTRQLALNMAMRLIAGCARNVASANGVAIGLFESNQLAYIAGSGSAASWMGRRVSATLSVAADARNKVEILRVEDADKEMRIEAAICRQFGAKSLLILPIYRGRALAGVIEIIFSAPHIFDDREVCTYHLMAGVAGEALAHSGVCEHTAAKSTMLTTLPEIRRRALHNEPLPGNIRSTSNAAFDCHARAAGPEPEKLASGQASSARRNSSLNRLPKPPSSRLLWWRFADPVAVIVVLVAAGWIAYASGRSASSLTNSARPAQAAHQQQEPLLSARSQVVERQREQPEPIPKESVMEVGRRTPQRVRIGNQEIDYVSEDVTVRHFIPGLAVEATKKSAHSGSR